MRRRKYYSTGYLFGYVILSTFYAFVDIIRGCFQLLIILLRGIRRGTDHTSARRDAFEARLRALVSPYLPVLVKKRQELLVCDDYGELRNERWSKELGYFMGKVLWPQLGRDIDFADRNKAYVSVLLDNIVAESLRQRTS